MKKLMIAAAIVCAAVASQAANYQWKSTAGYVYTDATKATKAAGTAYLFNAATFSQAQLLDAVLGEGTSISTLSSVYSADLAGGRIQPTDTFAYSGVAVGNNWSAYYATVIDGNVYISSQVDGIAATALDAPSDIVFGSQTAGSAVAAAEWTKGTASAGQGWYTAAAVPEPTSGLLLLLGVAGLALKRRRA